ncbi:hypothetical protein PA905_34510 [Planktothrix agardhii CCAP 1459/11A]|jgi:hypothetical protein|uniref:Uncharacterized protein n=1 Tax=Planktothrix agardhii CCAP 1459/11A TaxID=282420 RepID=A0A4P5ZZS1_PLAAG|nr:hypothetical protein PA905_34510 [Planktothrix agardhii CCAP 1459/11A]CAD5967977.1 hypothetical protein NO108_03964 [Planktothrix rubescens]CAD5976575.1 hypothetical protein PCC7821_04181 [Planktothrix rubescens NIVA-CYA 18]CAD5980600.1 hypothetical protein NO758_04606 [Planktothrix agardhii]CAH2574729.1 hypothetical protein PRNO82_04092 [Planktothrix rubescens]
MPTVSTLCFSGNFNLTLVWLNLYLGNTSRIVFAIKNEVKSLLYQHQNGIFSEIKSFAQFYNIVLVFYRLIILSCFSQPLDQNDQRLKFAVQFYWNF